MEYCKYLLSGLLILGFLHQGIAKPTKRSPTDEMQGDDDYNYNDDDGDTISDTMTTYNAISTMPPFFQESFIKKIAIEGDTIKLQCPVLNRAENNILFWYVGDTLISNQNVIIKDRYKLQNKTYSLIINDIKMEDAGEYYCKIIPQNLQLQVSVNVLPKGSVLPTTTTNTTLPKGSVLPSTTATTINTIPTTTKTTNKASAEKTIDNRSSSLRINSSYTILVSLVLGMLTYLRI